MKIFTKLAESFERSGRRAALSQLQQMSERQLMDCGFSPELLRQGTKAWPWRTMPDRVEPLQFDQVFNVIEAPKRIELGEKSANKSNIQQDVA